VSSASTRSTPKKWKNRRWTFDEMASELPESNLPVELWDGELVMSPAPSFRHQKIVARFFQLLDAWVKQHDLGETGIAPLDMVLTETRATQPDIVFIATENSALLTNG
jgi:Uma2 family endonuclease